jgi:hypothetical protein
LKQYLTCKGNQLQAVLEGLKENDVHGALKHGKNNGIAVCGLKETVLKEMAAEIE